MASPRRRRRLHPNGAFSKDRQASAPSRRTSPRKWQPFRHNGRLAVERVALRLAIRTRKAGALCSLARNHVAARALPSWSPVVEVVADVSDSVVVLRVALVLVAGRVELAPPLPPSGAASQGALYPKHAIPPLRMTAPPRQSDVPHVRRKLRSAPREEPGNVGRERRRLR